MWTPQQYISHGLKLGRSQDILDNAVAQIETLRSPLKLPSLLTLNHVAERTDVSYVILRHVVAREFEDPYRHFFIRKRSGGRRFICIPHPEIMRVQRWLAAYVLNVVPVHQNSYAFAPQSSIVNCAARHCGARWILKLDIASFFSSLTELKVYRAFRSLGYEKLISFELARLTTFSPSKYFVPKQKQWRAWRKYKITDYEHACQGFLPQGAPTSPMLSNLIMRKFDEDATGLAGKKGLVYTRYADDITFSCRSDTLNRKVALELTNRMEDQLKILGLRLNRNKTVIVPPGSRKIVLGLLVDGETPKLTREFRSKIRQHLHYATNPVTHAEKRGFESVGGMRRHLKGLIDFAAMVDSGYGEKILALYNAIDWP